MGEPVRVNVVAMDPMLEAGATSVLQCCPDIALVLPDEAAQVTVVIVDEVGPQALDVVRTTRNATDRPEVVLVATDLAPAEGQHAIAAGARGLLRRREASASRLARTVLAAASRDCTVPPDMLDRLLEHGAGTRAAVMTQAHWKAAGLSERERAVLSMVADGHETVVIARELCYSTRTVTSVLHDITQRFRLRNRAHAVAYALRAGLL
jgi:DNA-binding NarL/FixJ family response regulator